MDMPDFCASEAEFFSAEAMRVNRYVWPRSNLGPKVLQVLHDRFHSLLPISALMTASRHRFSTALYERFSTRGEDEFADKLLSAMRYQFGGHPEKPTDKSQGRLNVVFNHAATSGTLTTAAMG